MKPLCLILVFVAFSLPAAAVMPLDGSVQRGSLDQPGSATLPEDHPRHSDLFFSHAHTLSAEVGAVLEIAMEADFDTHLELLSPAGNLLVSQDDDGRTRRSRIQWRLAEEGPHTVVATSFLPHVRGRYLLMARPISAEPVLPIMTRQITEDQWRDFLEGRIEGEVIAGEITPEMRATLPARAPGFAEGIASAAHPIAATRDTVQSFDLSASFDGVLTLLAPDGTRLAQSDDFITTHRSRIEEHRFHAAGEHLLVVSGYASGEWGPYELTIGVPASVEE